MNFGRFARLPVFFLTASLSLPSIAGPFENAARVAGIAAVPVDATPTYTATPLGTLGGTGAYGNAINASGQITGLSYIAGNATWHAVI